MRTKSIVLRHLVILLVILVLVCKCDSFKRRSVKVNRRGANKMGYVLGNQLAHPGRVKNVNGEEDRRGFFPNGGLFALGKVLNFFPVGGERECQPSGHTIAKAGICLNPYDCRQRDGRASGDCAHGLGVCCVFEVSCGGTVQNNLTYFISPAFPELWAGEKDCNITIEKSHAGIMQLRIDFIHLTIGQPNRTTGECDEDAMILGNGENKFTLCGQNHGQHIYYTLSSGSEAREAGDLAGAKSTLLSMRMRSTDMPRLWLMRLAQMPLAHSAPHNCLQYYTDYNGTIKTFNYAINGRHLADHEYRVCVRRNVGFCSIRYTPCDNRSFRIGSGGDNPQVIDPAELESGPGESGGPGTGFYGPDGVFVPVSGSTAPSTATMPTTVMDQQAADTQNDTIQEDGMMPADGIQTQEDEMEGSGADPQIATPIETASSATQPSILSRIWSFIWPSWMWGQSTRTWGWSRWSPYAQHYNTPEDDKFRYYGYGNFGVGLQGFGRQRCKDRITIPCENEYFVSSKSYGPGVCDPHHCGSTFCPGLKFHQCRVETSISPFAVSIHFGPPTPKQSPEENIGACIRYSQLPCDS